MAIVKSVLGTTVLYLAAFDDSAILMNRFVFVSVDVKFTLSDSHFCYVETCSLTPDV